MKKTFKRAGVAVLSMAMLLSMGAVGAMSASAATVTVTDKQNTGAEYKYIKIATATEDNGRYKYSDLNDKFKDVLQINDTTKNVELKSALGSIAANTSIGTIASHSADAKALAEALVAKTADADYAALADLTPGYYLLKDVKNTSGGMPVLLSITSETSVTIEAKATVIPFNKTITAVKDSNNGTIDNIDDKGKTAVVEANSTVTYQLETEFPMYDPVNVVAKTRYKAYADPAAKAAGSNAEADWDGIHYTENANDELTIGYPAGSYVAKYASNITDFTITDVPEDTLTIDDNSIKVYVDAVDDANVVDAANYKLTKNFANAKKIVNSSDDYFTTSGTETAGTTGFRVVFNDDYVITNRGKKVYVTFDAAVSAAPDTGTDKNANQATVEYNNDYFTGGSKYNNDGTPVETPEQPDTQKDSEADVFATLLIVDKVDGSNKPLPNARFTLYKKSNNSVTFVATVSTDKTKFTFTGLGLGTYILEETNAPAGYAKAGNIEFTVDTTDTKATQYAGNFTYSNTGDATTTNNLKVVNYQGETLPGTGGIGTVLFTVGGAAVVLLAGFLFVVYMRKRQDEE